VIAVSATGPVGFGEGATNFDEPASYTNFGQRSIDFAAPGGNDEYRPLTAICTFTINPESTGSAPCYLLDEVLAPCRGGPMSIRTYCWNEGTSMAAPAVSGVAALIVGKYGPIAPAMVESILENSADDLGPEGPDPFYGRGRVNAFRAVQ
jgi:subtilisin family serine protease